jgi:hypothetical protein
MEIGSHFLFLQEQIKEEGWINFRSSFATRWSRHLKIIIPQLYSTMFLHSLASCIFCIHMRSVIYDLEGSNDVTFGNDVTFKTRHEFDLSFCQIYLTYRGAGTRLNHQTIGNLESQWAQGTGPRAFGLWSKVFPGYLGIRKALRAVQQDARGSTAQVGASQMSRPSLPLQCRQCRIRGKDWVSDLY